MKFILSKMTVDLSQLKDAQTAFDFSLPAAEIELETEAARLKDTVKIKGKITKQSAQTVVAGEIFADAEIECHRCLQPVEKKLEIAFTASFVTPEFYTQATEAELRADDLEVSVFAGDKIDLSELAREQILLDLPARVFCGEDCKGLCLKCGANRNLIDCNCEDKEADPRWAALKNLK